MLDIREAVIGPPTVRSWSKHNLCWQLPVLPGRLRDEVEHRRVGVRTDDVRHLASGVAEEPRASRHGERAARPWPAEMEQAVNLDGSAVECEGGFAFVGAVANQADRPRSSQRRCRRRGHAGWYAR